MDVFCLVLRDFDLLLHDGSSSAGQQELKRLVTASHPFTPNPLARTIRSVHIGLQASVEPNIRGFS